MGVKLVVTEKPDVARHFARALGCSERASDCYRGNGWVVTWTYGHLVGIAEPEEMNAAWSKPWRAAALPMVPTAWRYSVRHDLHGAARKQFQSLKRLMLDSAVEEIVCATDAAREGELIFRLIYQAVGSPRRRTSRVWNKVLTDEAIARTCRERQPLAAFDAIAKAGECRELADWLVGLNGTRAYTLRNSVLCSIGRVQTPTLALVVTRQREIENFRPTSYHELQATLEPGFTAKYVDASGETRIAEEAKAAALHAELEGVAKATVTAFEEKDVKVAPPALFNLTELQAVAERRFGYAIGETLEIAQRLYESQLLTYPRTASRHMPTDMVPKLPEIIRALPVDYEAAKALALTRLAAGPPLGKAYVDDAKLTDHHAIVPTETVASGLGDRESNIYRLVVERFLAVFMPDAVRVDRQAMLQLGAHTVRARGSAIRTPGWQQLIPEDPPESDAADADSDSGEAALPALAVGQVVAVRALAVLDKQTTPPRSYTEGTLGKAMERLGLGTEATRTGILKRLFQVDYLEKRRRALLATAKGVAIIDQVSPELTNVALTSSWEKSLAEIEAGEGSAPEFMRRIEDFARAVVSHAGAAAVPAAGARASAGGAGLGPCPKCRAGQVRQVGAKETFYGCSRWREGCDFKIPGQLLGKSITERQVTDLLTKRKTAVIKGFKSKRTGQPFDASLKVDEGSRVTFAF
jgi:DNA topoisomerase III